MNLQQMGWSDYFETRFSPFRTHGLIPGRVVRESRHIYDVCTESGRYTSRISGHFQYTAAARSDYPTVGDWVSLRDSDGTLTIEKVLERRSSFSRRAAGGEFDEQVIAANIDILCIVSALDGGRSFNLRGIERYLALAMESGSRPVVVLNKVDLAADAEAARLEAQSVSPEVPIHAVSALTGQGLDELCRSFAAGATVALTGPSGVGKSALINALLGEEKLRTGAQREDDLRGRHTTTHKELFFLPGGAMLIDTPGLRELGLWGDEDGLDGAFSDIAEIARKCRFRDCSHRGEPGCAVQKELSEGNLEHARYENYLELRSELAYLNSRADVKSRLERKAREKELSRLVKDFNKRKE